MPGAEGLDLNPRQGTGLAVIVRDCVSFAVAESGPLIPGHVWRDKGAALSGPPSVAEGGLTPQGADFS